MTKNDGWISADDVNRLIREIDVALNGVDAAPQASLCDIAAQVGKAAREFGPILGAIGAPPKPAGAHSDDWAIAAAFREVTGPNGGLIKNDEVVDFISTRAREMIANARPDSSVPLPDRDAGGKIVREAWVRWALAQADAKPSWLVPYEDLSEADKEADRQIFEACAAALVARTMPEGWKITRNKVGGIHVEGPEGWMSMPDTTPKNGNFSLEMRLLYGLAEAMLTAAPAPQHVQENEWRQKAAEWLEQKALDQEQVNRDYPRHASAYKEWRDRPMILRMLAQDIVTAGDEQAMIKRNCRPPTWMFPDDDFPAPRSLQPGDGWDENVRYLLNRCKHTIRVREGGGAENLLSSLIVTFTGMEQKIAAADSVDSKAVADVIEVARDVAKRAGPDREQKLHESLAVLDTRASPVVPAVDAVRLDDVMKERLIDAAWDEYVHGGVGAGIVTVENMRCIVSAVVTAITSHATQNKGT